MKQRERARESERKNEGNKLEFLGWEKVGNYELGL